MERSNPVEGADRPLPLMDSPSEAPEATAESAVRLLLYDNIKSLNSKNSQTVLSMSKVSPLSSSLNHTKQ